MNTIGILILIIIAIFIIVVLATFFFHIRLFLSIFPTLQGLDIDKTSNSIVSVVETTIIII
jgi:hypothetical protein